MHEFIFGIFDVSGYASAAKTLSDGGPVTVALFILLLIAGCFGLSGALLIRLLVKVIERGWNHLSEQLAGERAARVELQRIHDEFLDKARRENLVRIQESSTVMSEAASEIRDSRRVIERAERMMDERKNK